MNRHILHIVRNETSRAALRHGPLLRALLDALVEGCQQATRLRVDGRSTAPGSLPGWLEDLSFFEVVGIEQDQVVLTAPSLEEASASRLPQRELFADLDTRRSCLDFLEDSLEHAVAGVADSDRYDRPLMATLETFGRLFHYGIECVEMINGRTIHVDRRGIEAIQRLRGRTPEDALVTVTGKLETIRHSDRAFTLVLPSGDKLRGIATSPDIRAAQLASLFGEQATVTGIAKFRPSGKMLRIEAEAISRITTRPAETETVRDEIRRLIQEGKVDEARQRLDEETAREGGEALQGLARLIAPPTAAPASRTGRGDLERNMEWLRAHKESHRGAWVALRDGELVASDGSLAGLRAKLRASGDEQGVLCVEVGADDA